MTSRRTKVHAFWPFFLAASSHAVVSMPLSLAAALGEGWPPGLLGSGHGHEMIFGFALALVAGYTLGPQPRTLLALLLTLWLLARITWTLAPDSLPAQVLSPAFALVLARYVVPRFSAAKKWRNKTAAPLILAICLMAPGFWVARSLTTDTFLLVPDTRQLMQSAILGLLLLMTFIGGRMIAPAVAGTLEKQGHALQARVQPRVEGALIILLGSTIGLSILAAPAVLTAVLLLTAAVLIVVRVTRWQLWHCADRTDLIMLALGYLWLAVGAGVTAVHLLTGTPVTPALHLVTIGALGTLSSGVMLRLAWQLTHRRFPPGWQVALTGTLLSIAALLRYLAGPSPFAAPGMLWLSGACWSLAYLVIAGQLVPLLVADSRRRK